MHDLVYRSDQTCIEQLRMNIRTFKSLCAMLQNVGKLKDTKHMMVDEQVALFLHILAHHVKNRVIKFRFHHSGETISRHFRNVLNNIIRLREELIKKPEPIPEGSLDEKWKWFKNCIGAIDGTYIKVIVPLKDKPRYRNRKGEIATNVLAACSHDGLFTYVLAGWEGSAADGRVLREALCRPNGLKVPIDILLDLHNEGKYKADRGFKPGFFDAVERAMRLKLPESGIKARPHIESRLKTLEDHFNIVLDMMESTKKSNSGFGWDPIMKCVTAPKNVWDEYLQSHKKAAKFREKPFPYYEEFRTIFGVDRANGNETVDFAAAEEDINREEEINENLLNEGNDIENSISASVERDMMDKVIGKRKRKVVTAEEVIIALEKTSSMIEKATDTLGVAIINAAKISEDAIKSEDAMRSEKIMKINGELKKLSGLTMEERHTATRRIGCDVDLTCIFISIEDDEKEAWVKSLLKENM
ncbi:hypothetical protein MLD38_033035 [Melastoma candidum]|uniref:Uncharacterized protein n=1 Tax=Melastoma candidum TaxID=119954 RepID=A0ACB9M5A8_9MYRT|nr:hypothetical protein MLD38_033035 [Melastoma candidum]